MAENYVVNYQINVESKAALASIQKFQEATAKMEALTRRFDAITTGIGKVNSALASLSKRPVEIRINTQSAEAGLRRVLGLLQQVNNVSKGVKGGAASMNTRTTATDLNNLSAKLQATQKTINAINRNYIHPKANVGNAIKSLDSLLAKIEQVKANGRLTITASAAGASSAVGAASVGAARSARTSAPRSGGAGHSTYLYPTTRQVLGPTYANTGTNVAGEMVKGMGVAYGLSSLMTGLTNVFREATEYNNITQTTKNILETHDKLPNFEGRFDEMNRVMRQVGVETKYTSPQVASAGKFLAMAGLNVDQIKDAIRPISDIALVGDTDLGETADVVTNIMTAYEIPSRQMNNAADILTMTFTKTNTTLMELAESFKYAGTVAHQSGLDFETASAAFGVLGDAGIKGSHAGTTMRMLLMNMIKPTKAANKAWEDLGVNPKDAEGNLRPLIDILSELREKQKTMSSGDFTQYTTTMARITAVPGFLALINSVDKLREVDELNRNSFGLASNLADEKKNTILGLWDQMTSAFVETGMQQFEAMQNAIRDFLKRMIALMESPDFAEAMRSSMDVFMQLANVIVDVFKKIMTFWNWIPDWGKDLFITFVKWQMILGIGAGISKSIWSTWIAIRGLLMGQWLSLIVLKFGKILTIIQHVRNSFLLLRAFGWGIGNSLFGALNGGVISNRNVIGNGGQIVGQKALGTLSTLTPLSVVSKIGAFLATNPAGWIFGSALAVSYLGYKIYKTYQATEAARKANEAWGESYRNLGIDKLNLSEPDSLLIGNMRIFNNELTTQNEKIRQSADLWHRYWIEKQGPKQKVDDQTKFVDSIEGQSWKDALSIADEWFGVDKAFRPIVKALNSRILSEQIGSGGNPMYKNTLDLFGNKMSWYSSNGGINENAAVQLQLAKMGADQNNEQKLELERYLSQKIWTAHSYHDFQRIIKGARDRFVPDLSKANHKWDWISSETAGDMTLADIQNSYRYMLALRANMEKVLEMYQNLAGGVIKKIDEGQTVTPMEAQAVLQKSFGWLFDTNAGLFGSQSWMKRIQEVYKNPGQFGLDKNSSEEEISSYIIQAFDSLINLFNTLDTKYKPAFASFLNRSPWEQSLFNHTNSALPEGGVTGGSKLGDKMTVDGKTYTWQIKTPFVTPQWIDKSGNIYSPKDAKKTNTWTPKTNSRDKLTNSLHNGADQSRYRTHYDTGAAPKQMIVRIDSLMKVGTQTIDLTDERKAEAVNNVRQELASALLSVVQDFNQDMG